MGEVRGDEWLPEGWKVEVRVRKSGRKDRYYTDPASGYVFRSLKDIDRYLVSGKLGRHSMKSKHNDVADGKDPMSDADGAPVKFLEEDWSKKKCSNMSSGSKKRGQKQNPGRNGKKKSASGATNLNHKSKSRKISKSPQKGSDDFFILDSDQGGDVTKELGLPNYPEIIDSLSKSEDNRNATYLSAPEIALLLGRQTPTENASNRDHYEYPKPLLTPLGELEPDKTDTILDSPLNLSWGEICSDPCIEFAIKTLTGAIPLGSVSDDQKGLHTATNEEGPDLVQGNN